VREVTVEAMKQKTMQQPYITNHRHAAKAKIIFFSTQIMKKQQFPIDHYGVS